LFDLLGFMRVNSASAAVPNIESTCVREAGNTSCATDSNLDVVANRARLCELHQGIREGHYARPLASFLQDLASLRANKTNMILPFEFQVVGMDVVEDDFEMILLAAATRNVVAFLMETRDERAATPEDAAAKSREETPKEGCPKAGAPRSESATTEWGAAATGGTAAAALSAPLGVNAERSENEVTTAPQDAGGVGAAVTLASRERPADARFESGVAAPVMQHPQSSCEFSL
jgi:hypothetical protein